MLTKHVERNDFKLFGAICLFIYFILLNQDILFFWTDGWSVSGYKFYLHMNILSYRIRSLLPGKILSYNRNIDLDRGGWECRESEALGIRQFIWCHRGRQAVQGSHLCNHTQTWFIWALRTLAQIGMSARFVSQLIPKSATLFRTNL